MAKTKNTKRDQSRVVRSRSTRPRTGTTAATNQLPRGKAKTAYELLERVCEAIKAHPLNYYQGYWKAVRGGNRVDDNVCELPSALNTPENTCGTAFCRAGWIVALQDGLNAKPYSFEGRAKELLGVYDHREFFGFYSDINQLFDGAAITDYRPGTRAYVREGIRGIRDFMKEHKAHLQSRLLKGV